MKDFWNNILRYPRFFISSVAGLLLVLLAPLKNLFKVSKLRTLVIASILILLLLLFLTIRTMASL